MLETSLIEQSANLHMWVIIAVIIAAMVVYSSDKVPLEITSIIVISFLLLFFNIFPITDEWGAPRVDTAKILLGFANPALITVVSLLVIGQAVVQTGALNEIANIIVKLSRNNAFIALFLTLLTVLAISGILNNTPVVVIFIPIIAALAKNLNLSVSAVMIPLSYVAILGGMLTLIGSSTNLLVSGMLRELHIEPLTFFEFTLPGSIMAGVGFVYILLIAPRLLPDRASFAKSLVGDDDRQFISQVEIDSTSDFVGKKIEAGNFPNFPAISVRMIQRGEHAFLPPFEEEMTIRRGDIIIVAATRKDITELLAKQPNTLLQATPSLTDEDDDVDGVEIVSDMNIAEVIITPASRMIGRNLEQIGFHHQHNCVVLGIQRQSKIIRAQLSEIRLAAGDVLLVMGKRKEVMQLQQSKDMLLLEWSTEEIHSGKQALRVGVIFASVVLAAALDFVPIAISSFVGATAVIITGCLNLRQARRAIDGQIILIVAASLAMGAALQATGGASYLAHLLISIMQGASPVMVMSALFLLMAGVTNILSNNASAVLFTPIAVNAATELGVDPKMFIYAVILACNCSFITPIGYQTNLLVMGPGHYKFSDFMRSGIPLAIIMWITYTLFATWHFGN